MRSSTCRPVSSQLAARGILQGFAGLHRPTDDGPQAVVRAALEENAVLVVEDQKIRAC